MTDIEYTSNWKCGVCYVEQLLLPNNILQSNKTLNKNNLYDVIFTSSVTQCIAYIIDNSQHTNTNTYCCKLPSYDSTTAGQQIIYSEKYGLISVGDANRNNCLSVLPLKNIDDEWEWKNMDWYWSKRSTKIYIHCIIDRE